MIAWIIAAALFALFGWLFLYWLANRKRPERKGNAGGIMMGLGLAFMTIFDPAKAETVEEVRRRKDLGDADQGESGEGKD